MAGWSGLSAAARGAVLLGGAAVVAVAGYFGFVRAPVTVVPTETTASGAADPAPVAGDAAAVAAPPSAESGTAAPPAAETPSAETSADAATEATIGEPAAVAEAPAVAPVVAPTAALAGPILPSFDVARIAPDGAATVAGQAAPGAAVVMLVDGVEVATAVADAQGKFAALFDLPPSPVARLLTLQATGADGTAVQGTETVALAPVVGAAEITVAGGVEPALQAPAAGLIAPVGV